MAGAWKPGVWKALAGAVLALALAGCGSIARPLADSMLLAAPASTERTVLDAYRFRETDAEASAAFIQAWRADRQAHGRGEGMTGLAVSAGGANGAYGAGLLVGWSGTGERPAFDIVTGVSTGALIAPFAFLGSDWDRQLEAAYTDPAAARLTEGRWGMLRRPSLFSGRSLRELVAKYVDARLLAAIAREHQTGRRLLVATTDLDSQTTVIWDMGAIALAGQAPGQEAAAVRLFSTVLVASSSIPGVFPPVMIGMDAEGPGEMHVDGGVTTPFVLAPTSGAFWRRSEALAPEDLYVIVNGELAPAPAITKGSAPSILMRAFDTMSKADVRAHLRTAVAFAAANEARLNYAAIPPELGADSMAFDPQSMRRLFDAGARAGAAGQAFASAPIGDPPPRRRR